MPFLSYLNLYVHSFTSKDYDDVSFARNNALSAHLRFILCVFYNFYFNLIHFYSYNAEQCPGTAIRSEFIDLWM